MEYHEKGCGEGRQLVDVLESAGFLVKQMPELSSDRGMIYATRSIKSQIEGSSDGCMHKLFVGKLPHGQVAAHAAYLYEQNNRQLVILIIDRKPSKYKK